MKSTLSFSPLLVPFSIRGSYLALSELSPARKDGVGVKPGLYLRTLHGYYSEDRRLLRLQLPGSGRRGFLSAKGSPGCLLVTGKQGTVEAVFSSPTVLRLRGRGTALRLWAPSGQYNYARPAGDGRWEFNLASQKLQLMLCLRSGSATLDAPWEELAATRLDLVLEPGPDDTWELEIHEFATGWHPPGDARNFETCAADALASYSEWRSLMPSAAPRWNKAVDLAAYVTWSSLVAPRGHLRRETMYMSKNWMSAVWSWDHCFNAIALAKHQPTLAWDQWSLMFDFQQESGALPDVASDTEFVLNFVKPPVHGWALREMRRHMSLSREQKAYALDRLELWTRWWLEYRDEDGDGLPQYNHGNDSGWDNASVFAHGMPVEGPDLATFLVLQMEVLAGLARELGEASRATLWEARAGELVTRLVRHSWKEGRFTAPRSGDHAVAKESNSLVAFMPLLLGRRLDPLILRTLLKGLASRNRFVTSHGLATESVSSPLYRPDGYWRGPIWAPSTLLILTALRDLGEHELASRIALRFCSTCARSGMAENFDALTGEGLRDRAYTWTSSVFLHLASEYSSV